MSNVTPINRDLSDRLERLARTCEEVGEARVLERLTRLGTIHCLAPEVSEPELVTALAAAGLMVSTVGGVQLIHRIPPLTAA